jgi:hypothetical protein
MIVVASVLGVELNLHPKRPIFRLPFPDAFNDLGGEELF